MFSKEIFLVFIVAAVFANALLVRTGVAGSKLLFHFGTSTSLNYHVSCTFLINRSNKCNFCSHQERKPDDIFTTC